MSLSGNTTDTVKDCLYGVRNYLLADPVELTVHRHVYQIIVTAVLHPLLEDFIVHSRTDEVLKCY